MAGSYKAIGLMSGSSLDGLDIAYCQFDVTDDGSINWELLDADHIPFSEAWYNRLKYLPETSALNFAKTNVYFGRFLAEQVSAFLEERKINIDFIASHGHTIFHNPEQRYTVQIGDGATIAALTGITTISNFREQDVALDGEGTPIAPAADQYLFPDYNCCLNIGGIANLTIKTPENVKAFDTCPANQLLNYIAQQIGHPFDEDGQLAKAGTINTELLATLYDLDYFKKSFPKSLSNEWIAEKAIPILTKSKCSPNDQLLTVCHLIGRTTADALSERGVRSGKLLITGGGAFNLAIIEQIQQALDTNQLSIDIVLPKPEIIMFKEAILMALMGLLRLSKEKNCFSSVTGSKRDTIGGALHLAN